MSSASLGDYAPGGAELFRDRRCSWQEEMLRQHFDKHVKRNYEDWLVSPLDEALAMRVVAEANNMAARALHYWSKRDTSEVYGIQPETRTGEKRYRDELAARECADFALLRDLAEAHKHVELRREPRRITRSEQTGPGAIGWGEGGYGEGVYGGGPQLVVTIDDGTKRPLTAIVGNVIKMWEQLLARWGL